MARLNPAKSKGPRLTAALAWNTLPVYDLRRARYEKQRQIDREVEPLATMQPAAA